MAKPTKRRSPPAPRRKAKPKARKPAKPIKRGAKPATKRAAKPATKRAAKPATKRAAKPATKPVAKPATKRAAKPVAKPATKPAAKPVAKPATKRAARPVAKPATKPTAKLAKPASETRPAPRRGARGTTPAHATGTIPPAPTRSLAPPEVPAPATPTTIEVISVEPPPTRSGIVRVVAILEDDQPIAALRRYLDAIPGDVSVQEGQVALGAAQLLLLPIAREHRGGDEVKELLDLMLSRWSSLPDRTGFHANEFLRNAFAAVGNDPDRLARLLDLLPADPSPELRFNVACAYAVMGDRLAMLAAIRAALAAGATAVQFRRDNDFAAYAGDDELQELLGGARMPTIVVDVEPHLAPVRAALEDLVTSLARFGEVAQLQPPTTIDAVLAAERAAGIQLPNDYRALLMLADGFTVFGAAFLGTEDYRTATQGADAARAYLERSRLAPGLDACLPLANWGQPDDWLLYDPHGELRGDAPGYVLVLDEDPHPVDDLVGALADLADTASEALATN